MKIGIIKEGKVPPDFRVALTPKQCRYIVDTYPEVEVFIQRSPIRTFKDEEYEAFGLPLVNNLLDCDVIIGVKEVNLEDLIPGKTFMFFRTHLKSNRTTVFYWKRF